MRSLDPDAAIRRLRYDPDIEGRSARVAHDNAAALAAFDGHCAVNRLTVEGTNSRHGAVRSGLHAGHHQD